MVTLQQLIFKLSEFWASRGCLLQQPLDIEMGAGTMHPETFLRVLGPTHWNVAYVQPSRRPADGRFGENPNRLFKHQQFQVILKPAPDEVQQLYLQSLEACGIDLRAHDVRFEEDNWESPTLGAWGIGWQVLFDGQEITQFTYFQQAGGVDLVADFGRADLRHRALRHGAAGRRQRVRSRVGAGREVPRRAASRRSGAVEVRVRPDRHAGGGAARASPRPVRPVLRARRRRCCGRDLVLPALDYCLKCSHMFNLLDASGGIGVTERTALHPAGAAAGGGDRAESLGRSRRAESRGGTARLEPMDRELLIEIGVEELPASWLPGLTRQLAERLEARLKEMRIAAGAPVESFSTPRRLTARVAQDRRAAGGSRRDRSAARPSPRRSARTASRRRPALGFAQEAGRGLRGARRASRPRRASISPISKRQRGKSAVDALPELLGGVLRDLAFPKQMHWDAKLDDGRGELLFGRPIRWLLFLYGGRVVPFTIGRTPRAAGPQVQDVESGALTYGHRFLATSGRAGRSIKVRSFDEYRGAAAEHFVDPRARRAARSDRARARSARAAARRPRPPEGTRGADRRSRRPRRVSGVVAGFFERGFLDAAAGGADDDARSSSALLSGRDRRAAS